MEQDIEIKDLVHIGLVSSPDGRQGISIDFDDNIQGQTIQYQMGGMMLIALFNDFVNLFPEQQQIEAEEFIKKFFNAGVDIRHEYIDTIPVE